MARFLNTSNSYGMVSRAIHWFSAITVFVLFGVGLWMVELDYYHDWYQTAPDIHRSVGVMLLLATLTRLVWYRFSAKPQALNSHSRPEKIAAIATHHTMMLLLGVMFVTGYLITTAQGDSLFVFNWFSIPSLVNGFDNLEDRAGLVHMWTAYVLMALAGLHAAGAIKHHFFDKDTTLKRMLGIR